MRVVHKANSGRETVRYSVEFTAAEMAACHNLYFSILKSNPKDRPFDTAMKKVAEEWDRDTLAQPPLPIGEREAA